MGRLKKVPLHVMAAHGVEHVNLPLGFDAFSNQGEVKSSGHGNDGLYHSLIDNAGSQVLNEGPVNLEPV